MTSTRLIGFPINSYKILKPFELQQFFNHGIFAGTVLDKKSGFIHLCKDLKQTKQTIWKFYQYESIKILQLPNDKLFGLKFESNGPGRELYPHLYSKLIIEHIEKIYSIDFDENQFNSYEKKINQLDKIIK